LERSLGNDAREPAKSVEGNRRPIAVWAQPEDRLSQYVIERTERCLNAYKANPLLVTEHANIERATAQGGYGRRQIYELVQNGADALIGSSNGRISIVLTGNALYCANEGKPIDEDGIDAILNSHISLKRGSEIGRFGLGFKSVLGVCSAPQFFSRSASFGFDADLAAKQILSIVPDAKRLPTLRISWPLDAQAAAATDPVLAELMVWATTVVKLPLDSSGTIWLHEDLRQFPAEFLLFSSHVGTLTFEDRTDGYARSISLRNFKDGRIELKEGETVSIWKVFHKQYFPSKAARADAGELADRESLPLAWAVPMQGRNARGRFWAFFPTEYFTTLSGIVNAPWKTNEDRQNLLTGVFNEELIDEVARIIAI
jgi:hypothetical protein